MFGVEQDFSYLLADCSVAGVAEAAGLHAFASQPLDQEFRLRTFAAAIRAIEHYELALKLLFQR